jgi:hypothetical protein
LLCIYSKQLDLILKQNIYVAQIDECREGRGRDKVKEREREKREEKTEGSNFK